MKKENFPQDFSKLKVALVHDFLLTRGGAERVFSRIAALFPTAPIYTLLADEKVVRKMFPDREVKVSFLRKFPAFLRRRPQWLLPFLPVAPETFDFREYDLVISSSGAWSKGIITRVNTAHLAYLHSPMRFVWDENVRYARLRLRRRGGFFSRWLFSYLRMWDHEAALRPDRLSVNSRYTLRRVEKFYRRSATVVSPPLAEEVIWRGEKLERKDFFLVVSRLSKSKAVSLAVEVCDKLDLPLIVCGTGPEEKNLRARAGAKTRFLGYVSDRKLARLYASARAVLFPAEDDFGLVMLEALANGTPVIAFDRGGAREIVSPGKTGELFSAQTVEVMADALRKFFEREASYDRQAMRRRAEENSPEEFERKFLAEVSEVLKQNDEKERN